MLEQKDGITCILEGAAGRLYLEPDAADLQSARKFQVELEHQRDEEFETRYQPAILTDGHRVEVVANIAKATEAAAAVEAGAEGVGLMRTEFLFLERTTPPSEEEQFEAYSTMTRAPSCVASAINSPATASIARRLFAMRGSCGPKRCRS